MHEMALPFPMHTNVAYPDMVNACVAGSDLQSHNRFSPRGGLRIAPEPPESLGHPGQADLFTPEMIKVNPKTTLHYRSSINHPFG